MQQHPVPQNVTSYQFRLIGNMTLKQFLELASGIVLAIAFYYSRFLFYLRWPLVAGSALTGVALAFLPLHERPLDIWIKNFFRSIYAPTQYIWKKQEKIPDLFIKSAIAVQKSVLKKPAAKDKTVLKEYLQSLPQKHHLTEIEEQEAKRLEEINKLFSQLHPKTPTVTRTAPEEKISSQPSIKIRVRKLHPFSSQTPQLKSAAIDYQFPIVQKPQPQPKACPPLAEKTTKPIVEAASPLTPPLSLEWAQPKKGAFPQKTVTASFSTKLPMPNPPDTPNIIAGMILTNESKILPNALLEIKNQSGATVRALKSNKLGQFSISSPLENGNYRLIVENNIYKFDIIEFAAEGKIISPIKVKAKIRKEESPDGTRPTESANKGQYPGTS